VLSKTIYQAERLPRDGNMMKGFFQWGVCYSAWMFIGVVNVMYVCCVVIQRMWHCGRARVVRVGYIAYNECESEVKSD
jgi:hypothetical protein